MQKKYSILLVFALATFSLSLNSKAVVVALDDANLRFDGSFHNVVTPSMVSFNRHPSEVYNHLESGIYGTWINQWVITQTGVRMRFKTTSPSITLTFQKRTGGGSIGTLPTNGFSVFVNGAIISTFSSLSFIINNPDPGNSTLYEVSFPNLWAVDLIGISIDDSYALDDPGNLTSPVYVAFGDSKTHGTGQYVSSAKTYPFLLAKTMGWNLYNIAVAGSTLGWAMALTIKNKHVDVVTIELGYNDWEYSTNSLTMMQTQYERLIDSIRLYQPSAKIFCITPIATSDLSGIAPYSLDAYRSMVQTIVSLRMQTDSKIFVIPGPSISSTTMLASGDVVHLSEAGAATLAQNLVEPINNPASIVLTDISKDFDNKEFKKKIKINSLNSSYASISIQDQGVYDMSIYTPIGQLVFTKSSYFTSGENTVYWESAPIKGANFYLVRIHKDTQTFTELNYLED